MNHEVAREKARCILRELSRAEGDVALVTERVQIWMARRGSREEIDLDGLRAAIPDFELLRLWQRYPDGSMTLGAMTA